MLRRNLTPWLVGCLLILSAAATALVSGFVSLGQARAAKDRGEFQAAAERYANAAAYLFWRKDLYEQAGVSAALAGDFPAAIAYFERMPLSTEEGWVWFCAARIEQGQLDQAESVCSEGAGIHDSATLYRLLAHVHRAQKDWDGELTALIHQTRLEPGDAYAAYRLGLLLTLYAPGDALAELTRASQLNSEVDSAVQTLRAAAAVSSQQPGPSMQKVVIGQAFGLVQDWELAQTAFETAIELDEENAEAWAWLGEAKQQLGQDGRAELDRALDLNRESANVRALRALYWSRRGRYEQMLAEYLIAAGVEPENPRWQAGIGDAQAGIGDLVSALAAYQRAVELAPAFPDYWRMLAIFCADNNVQLEEIGLPAIQQAVLLAPGDIVTLDALGYVYLSSGRYANAVEILLSVIEDSPDYFPAHIHLAMAYLAQGDRAAAYNVLTFVRGSPNAGAYAGSARELLEKYFP